jgi:hypothetical protein
MKSRDVGDLSPARQRKVEIVDMKMNNVKLARSLEDLVKHNDVVGERILTFLIEPQGPLAGCDEFRGGRGVAACE